MTSVTLSSDSFYDHKFHNLVPRALSPGFGGAAETRPTSKARKKRPGDEVANFINFCPGITRFLQISRMITILNLNFFFQCWGLARNHIRRSCATCCDTLGVLLLV